MKREPDAIDDAYLVRYHLGRLTDEEEARFEEDYLGDEALFRRVGLAEDELLDAYVRGRLSATDRQALDARLLRTERGRRRLAIAQALDTVSREELSSPRWWTRLLPAAAPGWRRVALFAPATLAVAVGLSVTARLLRSPAPGGATSTSPPSDNASPLMVNPPPATNRDVGTIDQRVAPSRAEPLHVLTPGVWRNAPAQSAELPLPDEDGLLVGLLLADGSARGLHAVTVEDAGGSLRWSATGLQPQSLRDGRAVILADIPKERLSAGEYVIGLHEDAGAKLGEQLDQYRLSIAKGQSPSR